MTKYKKTVKKVCPGCDGQGTSYGPRYCRGCKGRGWVRETTIIEELPDE